MLTRINYFQDKFYLSKSYLLIFIIILASLTLTSFAGAEIRFIESTQEAGLTYTGPTWGAQWADYNGDGYPDIFVTNHEAADPSLYVNKGDGTFEEVSDSVWIDKPNHRDTHGAAWADFDNDGDQDVLISTTTLQTNLLYVNDNGIFYERAEEYGVSYSQNTGRSLLWLDYDKDGNLDVFFNGHSYNGEGYPALFRQNEDGLFENVNSQAGIEVNYSEYSVLSDLTGDGVMDFIPYGNPYPSRVYDMTTFPFTDYRDELMAIFFRIFIW